MYPKFHERLARSQEAALFPAPSSQIWDEGVSLSRVDLPNLNPGGVDLSRVDLPKVQPATRTTAMIGGLR